MQMRMIRIWLANGDVSTVAIGKKITGMKFCHEMFNNRVKWGSQVKKILTIGIIIALAGSVFACGTPETGGPVNGETQTGKPVVIATLFPQYDFVRQVAGDRVQVSLLLPPGVESHSYDPTPRDIAGIGEADVFLYTGVVMEPWAAKIVKSVINQPVKVVDLSEGIALIEAGHSNSETAANGEVRQEGAYDPHFWLDPNNAKRMVEHILSVLIEIDPEGKSVYESNAEAYLAELTQLDLDFEDLMAKSDVQNIYYGGHFAFGYFAERYGLISMSPYDGFAPDAEPTPQRIAALIDAMKAAPYKVIYFEELVDPKIATIVSEETGAKMLLLHGAHNVSKQELEQGVTYISIMRENLEKLKLGMGYHG